MGDSREGLARELTSVIGDDPDRFAQNAQAFEGIHPTYVRRSCMVFGMQWARNEHFNGSPCLNSARGFSNREMRM